MVIVLVMTSIEVFSDMLADSYTNDTDIILQMPTVGNVALKQNENQCKGIKK